MTRNNADTNTVGYKKPPSHTQFKKGSSGNPKGRPRAVKNSNAIIDDELAKRVTIIQNGRRVKITKRQLIYQQLVNKAALGDPKSIKLVWEHDARPEAEKPSTIIIQLAPGEENL